VAVLLGDRRWVQQEGHQATENLVFNDDWLLSDVGRRLENYSALAFHRVVAVPLFVGERQSTQSSTGSSKLNPTAIRT
jgi:hypothetical protein